MSSGPVAVVAFRHGREPGIGRKRSFGILRPIAQTLAAREIRGREGWRRVHQSSLPLSPPTRAALAALVGRMAVQHPERFSAEALRQRWAHWARQEALGVLLSGLAASSCRHTGRGPPRWRRRFLVGCACILPSVTLWRAAKAVHACSTPGRLVGHLGQRLSHRFRTR
jgi:hypothetical protein